MQFIEVKSSQIPLDLLLEADPSEASVSSYLSESWCFAALDNERILAACIVKPEPKTLLKSSMFLYIPSYKVKELALNYSSQFCLSYQVRESLVLNWVQVPLVIN